MIQLSERLQMVASSVAFGGIVADVGCDHGYTSIYLVQQNIVPGCIAMDIHKGPLEKAGRNIKRCFLENKIETRLSDGLEALKAGEADSVLISGMGGALTVKILTEGKEKLAGISELVLQPQSEIFLVRRFLHDNHFRITEEKMIREDGKYYVALHAVPGKETYIGADRQMTEAFYHYGKYLLDKKDEVLRAFLLGEKERIESIRRNLAAKQRMLSEKTKERMERLEEERLRVEAALSYQPVSRR